MRQKRLQGSHFANDDQSQGLNNLVLEGRVDPCLSRAFEFAEIPLAHQLMYENKHPHGNMAVLVGAPRMGLGVTDRAGGGKQVVVPRRSVAPVPIPPGSTHVPPQPIEEAAVEGADGRTVLDATPVGAVMRRQVVSCSPSAKVEEIVRLLGERGGHVVVVTEERGGAVGIVSTTDLVLARQGRPLEAARALLATEIMTSGVVTCTPETTLDDAVSLMARQHLDRLVVMDQAEKGPRMVGILSMSDVIEATLGLRED
jgi:crotonyl-CoA carboxylase/reductase